MDEDKVVSREGPQACAEGAGAKAASERSVAADTVQAPIVTGDHNVVIYQGAQVRIPLPAQVATHRAALVRELADVHWGMDTYIEEEGAFLPIDALPYDPGVGSRRQNLLFRLETASRLLVLGEPGSGKSVALQRLAWQLARDQAGIIPVLVPLLTYAGSPLLDSIRAALQHTGHLCFDDQRAVEAFLSQPDVTCHLLFDGLNEVPPPHRDRAVEQLSQILRAYPRHAATVTSRSQDESWRRLRAGGAVGEALVIQPIAEEQIRAYLVAHLGPRRGHQLYGQLDERLRGLAQTPLLLWLIKEAGRAGEDLPGNRGQLFQRFVDRLLRRAGDLGLSRSLRDAVVPALARLAFEMHRQQTLLVSRSEALRLAAGASVELSSADVVDAAAQHGLLTGDDPLRFAPHQTMQEYFAAQALLRAARQERAASALSRVARQVQRMARRGRDLQALARDDWWAETFIQLAGLVDDPAWLARTVARANPWLAWWCVEEGQAVDEGTRRQIEDRSVRLLRSPSSADCRRAVQALAQMTSPRAVDVLFEVADGDEPEIPALAVQALLEKGEAVRNRALTCARQPDSSLHRAGLGYLSALLGQPMVWVPPGPFLMGSDQARDPQADSDELPQHEVTLPGYWIGRYPVTVARFRAFVDDSGYRQADERSLRGKDDHPVAYVNWHDAQAYCRWLADKTGLPVRLPSEAEWEKAARGTDGRIYPWGDGWDASRCNSGEGGQGGTTPVGAYSPAGDSPYGCADMAGNVWEWTRSLWGKSWEKADFKYPYSPEDGREKLDDNGLRVVRGGAFHYYLWVVRCAYRGHGGPDVRSGDGGFRCMVAPVPL